MTTDPLTRPLPAFWDGRPIEWGPWAPGIPTFICDRSKRKHGLHIHQCTECGSHDLPSTSTGLRHALAEDVDPGDYLRTHRNGKPVYAQEPRPPLRELHATRCPSCGHATVYDRRTNEAWDLDDTDYGPLGSTAP